MFNIFGKDQEDFMVIRLAEDLGALADNDIPIWDGTNEEWTVTSLVGALGSDDIINDSTVSGSSVSDALEALEGQLSAASGTRMIFWSSSPPTGWTQNTAINSYVMRIVNSSGGGTGGSDGVLTVFGSGKSTANHTLSTGRIPSHDHDHNKRSTNSNRESGSKDTAHTGNTSVSTDNTGGGNSHDHDLNNMDLQYLNVVRAEKD